MQPLTRKFPSFSVKKNLPLIISRLDSSKNVTMVVGAMVEGLGSSAKQSKVQCNNLVPIIHKARKIVSTLFFFFLKVKAVLCAYHLGSSFDTKCLNCKKSTMDLEMICNFSNALEQSAKSYYEMICT